MNLLRFYFGFTGRCSRKQYWLVYLVPVLAVLLLIGEVMRFLGLPVTDTFVTIFLAFLIWVATAVHVKRWHDIDLSGWWVLLGLVPGIGAVALIVVGCVPGTAGINRFGCDPRTLTENTGTTV